MKTKHLRFVTNTNILGLIILCSIGCSEINTENSNKSHDKELIKARIDSIGNEYIRKRKTKGFSIAVMQGNDPLYNRGFGFVDSLENFRTTNENIFLLASISKLMTSTIIMKLVDENKLSLDQSLLELLPDFPNPEQGKKIKLHHLLSNTSGLLDYAIEIDSTYLKTGVDPIREDYYNFFNSHELLFEPGTFYSYSNSGFLLAKFIIERITGNSLQEEIDRVINFPAGMDLNLIANAVNDPKTSTYFELVDTTMIPRKHWPWISGDGGLTSTSINLARFPRLWSNGTILSKESFRKMTAPTELSTGIKTGYGLGVRNGHILNERVIGHTGGNQSSYAVMLYFPEKELSVIVFDNTDNSSTSALVIIGDVALAALGKEKPELKQVKSKEEEIIKYAGIYEQFGYKDREPIKYELYFNSSDGYLYRKRFGSDSKGRKLLYLDKNEFGYEAYPLDRISFEMNDNGEPLAYKEHWNGLFKRMGFKETKN